MTQHNDTPNSDLPQFSVNVAPTEKVTASTLATLLDQFRAGSIEPLIIGDDNVPEAAVIPFSAFVRLMRHDHAAHVAAENDFQAELSQRVQGSDTQRRDGRSGGLSLEQLADELDEPARSMLRDRMNDG